MKTETLACEGSTNMEIDYKNKIINLSEFGGFICKISFGEIKELYKKINKFDSYIIEKVQVTRHMSETYPDLYLNDEYLMLKEVNGVIISEAYRRTWDLGSGYAQFEWLKIKDAQNDHKFNESLNK